MAKSYECTRVRGYMKRFICFILIFCCSACGLTSTKSEVSQWDFDHSLRFDQKKLSDNHYHIIVYRKNSTHFSQLSSFLMRQAYNVCQSYGFQLEVLSGVEDFNDRIVAKSYIQPSLKANLTCPIK